MSRSARLFETIQILRSADGARTARDIAGRLGVTPRTVYRDVAALQAMRVPIDGQAGVGYLLRPGYELPPLNFTAEEAEAIAVGLALLGRTRDEGLQAAAVSAAEKLGAATPEAATAGPPDRRFYASSWTALPDMGIDLSVWREAIRESRKLHVVYADADGTRTERTLRPLALLFYTECVVAAAWCELRADFRHFRVDRVAACTDTGVRFGREAKALRQAWRELHRLP